MQFEQHVDQVFAVTRVVVRPRPLQQFKLQNEFQIQQQFTPHEDCLMYATAP